MYRSCLLRWTIKSNSIRKLKISLDVTLSLALRNECLTVGRARKLWQRRSENSRRIKFQGIFHLCEGEVEFQPEIWISGPAEVCRGQSWKIAAIPCWGQKAVAVSLLRHRKRFSEIERSQGKERDPFSFPWGGNFSRRISVWTLSGQIILFIIDLA